MLAPRLAAAGEIAVDTEGDSLHHYPARLALVQVADPAGTVWLVDPLAIGDLAALAPVFADPRVTVVFHAGENDLIHLKRHHAFTFASIFDTSIAARFLGARALGLEVLLAGYLGVTLPPSRQKDDWSARPLSEAQEAYVVADVIHLIALRRRLGEELARAGRLAWVEEECAALAGQPVAEAVEDPDAYLRAKGARDLPPRSLAALRELHGLRDRLARAADRPPFKVLSGELLIRLAQALPRDHRALGALEGVTPRVSERWGPAILKSVERALGLPDAELPRLERWPRPRTPPAVSARLEALRRWRMEAAPRVGLEPGLLLPNRLIGAIAEAGPRDLAALAQVPDIRRWRLETIGREVVDTVAAAGRR